MNQLKSRFARFMKGRYGADQLHLAIILVCLALVLVNILLRSSILDTIVLAALLWGIFRSLSRDVAQRRKENAAFLRFQQRYAPGLPLLPKRVRDIKTHRYRTCPRCKKVLRLPKKTGSRNAKCPNCQHRFRVRIYW